MDRRRVDGDGTEQPVETRHAAFTVSRSIPAPSSEVYAAFADPIRGRWIRLPGTVLSSEHEFRVGGGETVRSRFATEDGAEMVDSRTRYLALVPGRLIVHGHEARVDEALQWVSLVTVELRPTTEGTDLDWTEQVTLLAAAHDPDTTLLHLRGATALRLNGLPGALRG